MDERYVVKIVSNGSTGTGTIIGNNLILTCYHCIITESSNIVLQLIYQDKLIISGCEILHSDKDLDLLLWSGHLGDEIKDKNLVFPKLFKHEIKLSTKFWGYGYPFTTMSELTYDEGYVSCVNEQQIICNGTMTHGNSGSCLYIKCEDEIFLMGIVKKKYLYIDIEIEKFKAILNTVNSLDDEKKISMIQQIKTYELLQKHISSGKFISCTPLQIKTFLVDGLSSRLLCAVGLSREIIDSIIHVII